MGMDGHLAVDQSIYSFSHFIKVFIVQIVHLLNQGLRCASCHSSITLILLLVHLLLLELVLLLSSNLLVTPSARRRLLLLLLRA